jgi:hypothetical protein
VYELSVTYVGDRTEISHQIIGASIEVHRTLGGPGLLESIYEAALCHELIIRGLRIHRQRPVQVVYKGVAIREPLFIDTGIKLGLLVNFGAPYVKDGVSRIINGIL